MFHFSVPTVLMVLPGIAGLGLFVGAIIVALLTRRERARTISPQETPGSEEGRNKWFKRTRTRYVLMGVIFWFALSLFLLLDLAGATSVFLRFSIAYAAFWALIGALLLHDSPTPHKILILGLFVAAILSVRLIHWNSRKPFLKDLYRIREGMTPAEVNEIMGDYMSGNYGGPPGSHTQRAFDKQGEVVTGCVTFRHTDEGWGNSDWGTVTFENGRVVRVKFYPD